jgi:hypothetical protein
MITIGYRERDLSIFFCPTVGHKVRACSLTNVKKANLGG